jgi:hypothetical protein
MTTILQSSMKRRASFPGRHSAWLPFCLVASLLVGGLSHLVLAYVRCYSCQIHARCDGFAPISRGDCMLVILRVGASEFPSFFSSWVAFRRLAPALPASNG